jgi:hypothetical protein
MNFSSCNDYKFSGFKLAFQDQAKLANLEQTLGIKITFDSVQFESKFLPDFESKCIALIPSAQSKYILNKYVKNALNNFPIGFSFTVDNKVYNLNIKNFYGRQNSNDIKLDNYVGKSLTYFYSTAFITDDEGITKSEDIGFYVNIKNNFSLALCFNTKMEMPMAKEGSYIFCLMRRE